MALKRKKKQGSKVIVSVFSAFVYLVLILISIFLFGILFSTQIVPIKFMIPLVIAYIVMCIGIGLIIINGKLKNWIKFVADFICLLFIIIFGFIIHYLNTTFHFMDNIRDLGYQTAHYYVVSLNNSNYREIDDITDKIVGTFPIESDEYKNAFNELVDKVTFEEKQYVNAKELGEDLINGNIDVIFASGAYLDIIDEEIEGFRSRLKIVHTISIKVDSQVEIKDVDVDEEPFSIYVSGIDVYGSISSVSRSDVNMIVTVNPNTHRILLTSIPRDYYVQLHGTTGLKDKLTHAGIYGVNMSVQTLEDLLEVDINYYVRVNFTTLVNLVDALGGVDVYSEYAFTSHHGKFPFKKGMNHMNGAEALGFVRERYSFKDGDRQRVKNQQALISGIINKVTSSSTIITKYSSILNTFSESFQTNMGSDKIYSLVNLQLASMPSWNIESISLNGSGKKALTYSYAGHELYVMEPDMNTVHAAQEKINTIIAER